MSCLREIGKIGLKNEENGLKKPKRNILFEK